MQMDYLMIFLVGVKMAVGVVRMKWFANIDQFSWSFDRIQLGIPFFNQ
jgi:hypothetical protein